MGTGEPFLSSSQPPISSSRWLWLKVSDLLNHVFPHRAKTWEQKPTKPGNILKILNLRGWKYGYRGTFPLFLTTFLNSLFSVIVGWNFRLVMFLCFLCTFVISILILSCQNTISLFFFLYIVNFGLDSPQINTSKEPNGRFGLFSHFPPLSQNVPDILATLLGSQVAEIREVMYPKMQNQQKDDVSHTNLSF